MPRASWRSRPRAISARARLQRDEVAGYLARVRFAGAGDAEAGLPELDEAQLRLAAEICLGQALVRELRRSDLIGFPARKLGWKLAQLVRRRPPSASALPSSSQIRLEYQPGKPPVLAVRIQEVSAWRRRRESPAVACASCCTCSRRTTGRSR